MQWSFVTIKFWVTANAVQAHAIEKFSSFAFSRQVVHAVCFTKINVACLAISKAGELSSTLGNPDSVKESSYSYTSKTASCGLRAFKGHLYISFISGLLTGTKDVSIDWKDAMLEFIFSASQASEISKPS